MCLIYETTKKKKKEIVNEIFYTYTCMLLLHKNINLLNGKLTFFSKKKKILMKFLHYIRDISTVNKMKYCYEETAGNLN